MRMGGITFVCFVRILDRFLPPSRDSSSYLCVLYGVSSPSSWWSAAAVGLLVAASVGQYCGEKIRCRLGRLSWPSIA